MSFALYKKNLVFSMMKKRGDDDMHFSPTQLTKAFKNLALLADEVKKK